jgi:hypothetical protein
MCPENLPVRRHLLIAGTGRAGTSFLVRYLTELGLDTNLKRSGEDSGWDENANAGLEDAPFAGLNFDFPYVIKSAWMYQCIDELLATDRFVLDAVIIPVRDLAEAAASRSVVERRAVHQTAPWMSGLDASWEEWAHVPGGAIFSMNPIDQGRLLAVGFHHLVQRLVEADIPIIFLAFPRLTKDPDYLFDKLRPVVPATVDHTMVCSAHQRVTDPAKVRIGAEIEAVVSRNKVSSPGIMHYESHGSLDAIAIRRELGRLRKQLADTDCARAEEQMRERAAAAEEGRILRDKISATEDVLAEVERTAQERLEAVQVLREDAVQHRQQVQCLFDEISQLRQEAILTTQQRRALENGLERMQTSRSWRLTNPYRAVGRRLVHLRRRITGL